MATTIDKRTRDRISRHIENLNSDDEQVSLRAERYLIWSYGVRALDDLIGVCSHRNPVVRYRAAWALGVLGDMRAAKPLSHMWLLDDVSRPAPAAIATLGVQALPFVEEALQERSASIRHSAILVLGGYASDRGDARAVELLKGSLNDPDSYVREDAKFLLEEIVSDNGNIQEIGVDLPTNRR